MAPIVRPLRLLLAILWLGAAGVLFSQESGDTGSGGGAYLPLYHEIRDAERALADRILGTDGALESADVERLQELAQEARSSLYGDLIDRSALLLMLAEERLDQQRLEETRSARLDAITASRELEERAAQARRSRSAALWGTMGTSAASFALAFTFWYLSEWQDEQYFLATTIDEAVKHRTYFKLFSWISYVSAGVGVISAGVSIPLLPGGQR